MREKNAKTPACAPQSAIRRLTHAVPCPNSAKAWQAPLLQPLREITQDRLPCFRGPSGKRRSYVAAPFARLLPNIARTNTYADSTRQVEPVQPADCCLRPSPRCGPRTTRAEALIAPNRGETLSDSLQPATGSPFIASCDSPHCRCQMLEALAKLSIHPTARRACVCFIVHAMFGPLRLSPIEM